MLALYAAFIQDYETITRVQAGYATLIVMLGALPSLVSMISRREAGLLPLMQLHGLFYSIIFGLPVFSSKIQWSQGSTNEVADALIRPHQGLVNSSAITVALVMTILGLICLYIGYYASRGFYSRALRPIQFLNKVPIERRIWIAWILYGINMVFQLVPALVSMPSVGQLFTPLGYLSTGILFLLALDKVVSKKHFVLLTAAIVFSLTIKILSGSLAQAVFFLVFLGILYWAKKRVLPWGFILISCFIAIMLNPIKLNYREYTRVVVDSPPQSYLYKARMFHKAAYEYFTDDDTIYSKGIDNGVVYRVGHSFIVFTDVIAMTPEQVPFWLGASYQTLWTSFIPRLLWPGKPQATIGNEFGHRYKQLEPKDKSTSYNLAWLPEFYANFGASGVVLGMFSVGILFRFLVQKLSVPISFSIEYVLGAAITFGLFYAESNFALMVGALLTPYLALLALLRVLTLRYNIRTFINIQSMRWHLKK